VTCDESSLGPYDVAARFGAALDTLGVAYYLGGSLASSIHGEPRSTNDVDLVASLPSTAVDGLLAALGSDFEVDIEDLRDAIRRRRATHIFFLPAFTRIDLYVCGDKTFDQESMRRRAPFQLLSGARIWISSAEDSVVRKLDWYRRGGEVSDRQWRDVLGMLRICGTKIDRVYLEREAKEVGVSDLLSEAWTQASS
jgi:hypothetical protein